MSFLNFKLSDREKHDALWNLLNTNYNEENNWEIKYSICDIYDDYALVRNYETGTFERVYYTKNEENSTVELGEIVECFIIDVTAVEKNALEALRTIHNNTYELINETYIALQNNFEEANNSLNSANEKIGEQGQKIEELEISISTLITERDEANVNYTDAQTTISSLTEELNALKQYKLDNELKEKRAIIASYTELLDKSVLESYTEEKIASYSVVELDKELTYELKRQNPSVFSRGGQYVPKDDACDSGVEALLAKYVKND